MDLTTIRRVASEFNIDVYPNNVWAMSHGDITFASPEAGMSPSRASQRRVVDLICGAPLSNYLRVRLQQKI